MVESILDGPVATNPFQELRGGRRIGSGVRGNCIDIFLAAFGSFSTANLASVSRDPQGPAQMRPFQGLAINWDDLNGPVLSASM